MTAKVLCAICQTAIDPTKGCRRCRSRQDEIASELRERARRRAQVSIRPRRSKRKPAAMNNLPAPPAKATRPLLKAKDLGPSKPPPRPRPPK